MTNVAAAGTIDSRRAFRLPEGDEEFLNANGLRWETVTEQGYQWLILHRLSLPAGYNQTHIQVAVQIPPGYPDAPLDMVYVYPALARGDGRAIGALATQMIEGHQWQRWSRHRTPANPWRPGLDDISTHMALIEYWFAREFEIR